MENKDNAVSVTYNPDCEFVVATLNKQSGVTNVTTGSISDVKSNLKYISMESLQTQIISMQQRL